MSTRDKKHITIYAILLGNGTVSELFLGEADTLNDAFINATNFIGNKYLGQGLPGFDIVMFNSINVYVNPPINAEIKLEQTPTGENTPIFQDLFKEPKEDKFSKKQLLKRIVNEKNKVLYKEFKKMFTVNEKIKE